jgi:hypothetical protein
MIFIKFKSNLEVVQTCHFSYKVFPTYSDLIITGSVVYISNERAVYAVQSHPQKGMSLAIRKYWHQAWSTICI